MPKETNEKDDNISSMITLEIKALEAKSKQDAVFIDVREQSEWDESHIEGALFCPLSVLTNETPIDIPDNKDCIIYCRSGKRSQKAIEILSERGHKNLINLDGGYLAWTAA